MYPSYAWSHHWANRPIDNVQNINPQNLTGSQSFPIIYTTNSEMRANTPSSTRIYESQMMPTLECLSKQVINAPNNPDAIINTTI